MTILVIGPSHTAGFKSMLNTNMASFSEPVHIAGIHGASFSSGELFKEIDQGVIRLQQGIDRSGRKFNWFISEELNLNSIDLKTYSKILLLSPLFLTSSIFGKVLFRGKSGGFAGCSNGSPHFFKVKNKILCSDFVKADKRLHSLFKEDNQFITKNIYFEIYKNVKSQDVRLFEIIKRGCVSGEVIILPPVIPPRRDHRASNGLLGVYHLQEQLFLLDILGEQYGLNGFPQPPSTYFEDGLGLFTKENFHMPAPDPHHPSEEYWYLLSRMIGIAV